MTTFTFTWNATFLALPSDIEDESLGAQRIRDTKAAVGERMRVDHSLAGDANDGKHLQVTLRNRGAITAIGLDATDGQFFGSAVAGNTELFYQDSNGRVLQLTKSGAVNAPAQAPPFVSGTVMLFAQAAPPTGWSLIPGLADRMIRTNNSGGGSGGVGWAVSGLTTNGHTLSIAEMPSHDHGINGVTFVTTNPTGGGGVQTGGFPVGTSSTGVSQGGNLPHDHGGVNSDGNWRPPYLDVLIAVKN